ncbi:MAG: hypothetical protein ACFCUI_09850 [Bernardetiaceae bacterium]
MSTKKLQHLWRRVKQAVYVSYERGRSLPEPNAILLLGEGDKAHKAQVWQNPRVQAAKAGARVHCINLGLAKVIVVEEPALLLGS